jgi:hypothetical protein
LEASKVLRRRFFLREDVAVARVVLNAEQEQEAQRVGKILQEKMAGDILELARLLVSKKDAEIFGKTEFEVRDRVHQLGAKAMETVLDERKKGGTKGPA